MDLALITDAARDRAEEDMLDRCEIRRPPVLGPLDTETGERSETPGELVYPVGDQVGKCKVFTYEPFETLTKSGDHPYTVQRYRVHVPVPVAGVQVEDEITIITAALDPGLAGTKHRVAGLLHITAARDQRLLVDDIVA